MNIQWFPGHMAKTRRQIEEKLKLIDVVVEILDARIPVSSQNPDISEMTKGKPRVAVLNKADLADETVTKQWVSFYKQNNVEVTLADCAKGRGINESVAAVKRALAEKLSNDSEKGMNRAIKILVAGVPNVGKSSYINRLSGNRRAAVPVYAEIVGAGAGHHVLQYVFGAHHPHLGTGHAKARDGQHHFAGQSAGLCHHLLFFPGRSAQSSGDHRRAHRAFGPIPLYLAG
mgnify:CR=1 FL=1